MARKLKTQPMADGIAGQHLALSVAAHLARTHLVRDPLNVYDGEHLSDMLNVVAGALARIAPLYVAEQAGGEKRQLSPGELEGAVAKRGATVLVLKDGRTLAGVSVRRADLRQAMAVLKAIGLPEIAPHPAAAESPPPRSVPGDVASELLARFAEVEKMLAPPLLPAQVDRAKAAAVHIARRAPQGRVANLAMQLMSALHESRGSDDVPGGFRMTLARLRAALEEAANPNSSGTE